MGLRARLKRIGLDTYLLLLLGTVALATLLPAAGLWATIFAQVAYFSVALLFFLYGARLNSTAVLAGIANWRLQLTVLAITFLAFPALGIGLVAALGPLLEPNLRLGLLFLTVLPSTVQSSIAFTGLAGGNVPAAVCAASLSNLAGVVVTPALAALLLATGDGGFNTGAVGSIAVQILLPFAAGQLLRPLIGRWIEAHRSLTLAVDRGSILLIVYSAFSAGVVAGIWSAIAPSMLALVLVADAVLLIAIAVLARLASKAVRFGEADGAVILFCGATKSLASGLPIASILFAGQAISLIVLPLMLFHQIQLMVFAVVAQRQASRIASTFPVA